MAFSSQFRFFLNYADTKIAFLFGQSGACINLYIYVHEVIFIFKKSVKFKFDGTKMIPLTLKKRTQGQNNKPKRLFSTKEVGRFFSSKYKRRLTKDAINPDQCA